MSPVDGVIVAAFLFLAALAAIAAAGCPWRPRRRDRGSHE